MENTMYRIYEVFAPKSIAGTRVVSHATGLQVEDQRTNL